jgi:hypothetical protein
MPARLPPACRSLSCPPSRRVSAGRWKVLASCICTGEKIEMMFKVFKYAGNFIELLLDRALNYLSFDYLYPCCYAILAVGDGGSLH